MVAGAKDPTSSVGGAVIGLDLAWRVDPGWTFSALSSEELREGVRAFGIRGESSSEEVELRVLCLFASLSKSLVLFVLEAGAVPLALGARIFEVVHRGLFLPAAGLAPDDSSPEDSSSVSTLAVEESAVNKRAAALLAKPS